MTLAGDTVQNRARDLQSGIERRESPRDGAGRLRLSADVDREDDGNAETNGDIGRRAGAPAIAGDAVEQAHRRFDDQNVVFLRCRMQNRRHVAWRHRPTVDIRAIRPAGGSMKCRIDVVRSAFQRAHPPSVRRESAAIMPIDNVVLPAPERGAPISSAEAVKQAPPRRPARCAAAVRAWSRSPR